jgi:hypothetical protein
MEYILVKGNRPKHRQRNNIGMDVKELGFECGGQDVRNSGESNGGPVNEPLRSMKGAEFLVWLRDC